MKYKSQGPFFVIRIDKGEEIFSSLIQFCKENNISSGSFVGIGATAKAELAVYDLEKKQYNIKTYNQPLEITNITGNITLMDNEPVVHAHITLSDEQMNVVGGHMKSAVVSLTCEIYLTKLDAQINRKKDEETGLNLLDL